MAFDRLCQLHRAARFPVCPPRLQPRRAQLARMRAVPHYGLTLFEIVLALAILMMGLAALSQLFTTGARASIEARLQTQAVLRCESVLNEVIAGIFPMEATADQPFDDDPNWTWSLEVLAGPHEDLLELQVIVTHHGQRPNTQVTYALNRYIRDPQIYIDAELAATASEEDSSL